MQQRTDRVARLLLKEISKVICEDIDDPKMGFVTILRVGVAKDLRSARICYSILGDEEARKAGDLAIQRHAKQIKFIVNKRVKLKYAVDFHFVREDGIDNAFRVEQLLNEIQKNTHPEESE
ncbi:MAG: 30S ribosome-binding factor RbfA [Candidatus Omnitrophica bacterium]|nr:30S ribosome-binding factor RbfA [Candidatus Omnitrophota bacterium]